MSAKTSIPEGIWIKCKSCKDTIYSKDFHDNLYVCPKCDFHDRLTAMERIQTLLDENSFVEYDANLGPVDVLEFNDSKSYSKRIEETQSKLGTKDAIVCGQGELLGHKVEVSAFDFYFMGGSMGSVVGEKITRSIERGIASNMPVIIISCSGGARMQESTLSLMQMAKTSAALQELGRKGIPYISVLADPTTGGVTASFAMLGDLNIAEPNALIGFAGPRVIEQTIRQKLPQGFQRAEFLLEHGMLDMVLHRKELRPKIAQSLELLGF
ncbi:acetyl-CoA carboxylase, carboxyltransferase subunit beta [Desulfurispira natronophila]|uniref:Acetyl-coenzyme A carboxylase carboxyl transferase subunit beta n=1 Tax=Desulfurispira natronophila TaxID=682562 RepID=A0A7W7Y2P2_9BACT|nr:acetyl-CoA carboxylase, carboxyltransferase subunit beta [Desulfurispira natronophila]MBB5020948.1 acetyl-CoA carboxylase carboxyl transferase subunit beta [Desulfurispira natronophila]